MQRGSGPGLSLHGYCRRLGADRSAVGPTFSDTRHKMWIARYGGGRGLDRGSAGHSPLVAMESAGRCRTAVGTCIEALIRRWPPFGIRFHSILFHDARLCRHSRRHDAWVAIGQPRQAANRVALANLHMRRSAANGALPLITDTGYFACKCSFWITGRSSGFWPRQRAAKWPRHGLASDLSAAPPRNVSSAGRRTGAHRRPLNWRW